MNLELASRIRAAINDTTNCLRSEPPEATRAALQTHLDALLKAELQALTSPASDADLTEKTRVTLTVDTRDLHAELCRIQATILERKADVVKDPLGRTYIDPRKDALWYPDDSGEWVEVPDDCMACPVSEDTVVGYLLRRERERMEGLHGLSKYCIRSVLGLRPRRKRSHHRLQGGQAMTYEVQFKSGGTDYTVRAETIEDTLALIQRVQALTKPADDGWVEWYGGNRPVAAHCKVEVVVKDGGSCADAAHNFSWSHTGGRNDIVRYRVCK